MHEQLLKLFGIFFIISGVVLLLYSLRVSERIKRSRVVEAKIVDIDVVRRHRHSQSEEQYAAIYEYYEDGEYKRYTGIMYSLVPPEIGKETVLYISDDGAVSEATFLSGLRIGGIVALIFGIIMVKALS